MKWELGTGIVRLGGGIVKQYEGVSVMGKESVLEMLPLGAMQPLVSVGRRSHRQARRARRSGVKRKAAVFIPRICIIQ